MHEHESGPHRLGVSSGTGWSADQGCETLQCQAKYFLLVLPAQYPCTSSRQEVRAIHEIYQRINNSYSIGVATSNLKCRCKILQTRAGSFSPSHFRSRQSR